MLASCSGLRSGKRARAFSECDKVPKTTKHATTTTTTHGTLGKAGIYSTQVSRACFAYVPRCVVWCGVLCLMCIWESCEHTFYFTLCNGEARSTAGAANCSCSNRMGRDRCVRCSNKLAPARQRDGPKHTRTHEPRTHHKLTHMSTTNNTNVRCADLATLWKIQQCCRFLLTDSFF